MANPLSLDRARRLRRILTAALVACLAFIALLWGVAASELGYLPSSGEVGEFLVTNLTSSGRVVVLGLAFVIGLCWTGALVAATTALWGGFRGMAIVVGVLVLQRYFSAASLAFAVYLLVRLRPSPDAGADEPAAPPSSGASIFPIVMTGVLFGLPVIAALFSAVMLWTQEPTADWHWAVKLPAAVMFGGVAHWITMMVTMGIVGAVGRAAR
jgi:hypothetical protein